MSDNTFDAVERRMEDKYVMLTKKQLKVYLLIAVVLLTSYGYANYRAALEAARIALTDEAAVTATKLITDLKTRATADAATIAAKLKALPEGNYILTSSRVRLRHSSMPSRSLEATSPRNIEVLLQSTHDEKYDPQNWYIEVIEEK